MQQNDVPAATISFDIHAEMSSEQAVKEMYNKVASSNHPSKALMQSYIMIALSFDSVCSTARADATAAGRDYVPYTFAQYGTLIDRGAHAAYIVAAAAAVMPDPDPFVEALAEAHDDFGSAIDAFIAGKNWNQQYTAGGAAAIALAMAAQTERAHRGVATVLKECNYVLTTALCASFNAPTMTSYQHLVNLDFVLAANSPATAFGRIINGELRWPHLQCFVKLLQEFFRVARLRGSSGDIHFPLFNEPNLGQGLEAFKKKVDPYFINLRNYHFPAAENVIDYMQTTVRVAFIFKASKDKHTPVPLKREMITLYQAYCIEQNANPAPMNMARWERLEAASRTRCAAANILMVF